MDKLASINQVLAQMRVLEAQAKGVNSIDGAVTESQFSGVLTKAIDTVNEAQMTSGRLGTSYEKGEAGVSLADVMVAKEKAGVAFKSMVQVRNQLVEAYKDIMNMPI